MLVISVDAPPRLGGVAATAHALADAFAEAGDWSALLGPRGTCAPPGARRRYALIEDWESRLDRRTGAAAAEEDARIARLVAAALDRYAPEGILLGHAFHYGPAALAAARAAGVPVGCVVHGLEVASQLVGGGLARAAARDPEGRPARLKAVLDGADRLFANSAATAETLARAGAGAPVSVCGVGLSAEDFSRETAMSPEVDPVERRARRRALGAPDAPLLVYVGRLVAHKRVDRLLELAAGVPGLTVAIGGEGPSRPALEARAAALDLGARALFLGPVSEAEKWAWLRAADLHGLVSERDPATGAYEGFGIALLEGCAAGSVAVSSGADGMADFVIEAGGGLALDLARAPAAAARRVAALLDDPAGRARIVARGRAAIAARWLWPQVAARIAADWPRSAGPAARRAAE